MEKIYFILLILFFSTLACNQQASSGEGQASPGTLLVGLVEENRFLTAEEVADMLINDDPSLLLVDVRSHDEYDAFTLKGAINIPLEDFLKEQNRSLLDCERYTIVFFSNSSVRAEKAWILGRRLGCKDIYILKGGLNEWTARIMDPAPPPETASAEELELYQLHKAARKYFIGSSKALEPEPYVPPAAPKKQVVKKEIKVEPKPKKPAPVVEEEGC